MDAAHFGRRPLGALLVEAGLVSEHDLVEALAEQHGSFLKTEHGFGTGLRAVIGGDSAPESEGTPPRAPPLSPTQPFKPAGPEGLEEETQSDPDLEHLLFVPTYQGYRLLERGGTAPGLGEIVELPEAPGARLIVAKLASSPLPNDARICVYLNNL